jgi:hypothetical protein
VESVPALRAIVAHWQVWHENLLKTPLGVERQLFSCIDAFPVQHSGAVAPSIRACGENVPKAGTVLLHEISARSG